MKQRQKFTDAFKSQVALEAIRERFTLSEIAAKFGVHSAQILAWKKELQDRSIEVFDKKPNVKEKEQEQKIQELYGIKAVYPKRRTTLPGKLFETFHYLLKGLKIDRPNQVWASDITYIRLGHGYFYLTVIFDWHSRKALSWRLSNSLEASFCVEALIDALAQ